MPSVWSDDTQAFAGEKQREGFLSAQKPGTATICRPVCNSTHSLFQVTSQSPAAGHADQGKLSKCRQNSVPNQQSHEPIDSQILSSPLPF